MKLTEHQIWFT